MAECTCANRDLGRYRLLAFEHAAEMDAEVNRLLSLSIRPAWRLEGSLTFFNGGYRREMVRDVDTRDARDWLLPRHSPPVCH